jgi:peptidoglycan hydrolase CwlO-like protein
MARIREGEYEAHMAKVWVLLLGIVAGLLLVGVATGCGLVPDQSKQEAKKKVEAGQEDLKKKVDDLKKKVEAGQEDLRNKADDLEKKVDQVQKDMNDLQKKVNELLKKVDAQEQQRQKDEK